MVLFAIAAISCEPMCSGGDGEHCEGEVLIYCADNHFERMNCNDINMFCVDNELYVGCALSYDTCAEGKVSICVDDVVGHCVRGVPTCGIWSVVASSEMTSCKQCAESEEVCVDGTNGEAFCAVSNESCQEENEVACHPEQDQTMMICSGGYWKKLASQCGNGTVCVEIPDSGVGVECQ